MYYTPHIHNSTVDSYYVERRYLEFFVISNNSEFSLKLSLRRFAFDNSELNIKLIVLRYLEYTNNNFTIVILARIKLNSKIRKKTLLFIQSFQLFQYYNVF